MRAATAPITRSLRAGLAPDNRRTIAIVCGLILIAVGLAFVSTAAAIAVPGALLFLIGVPASELIRRGGL